MSVEEVMLQTGLGHWVFGLCGISFIVFLINCIICCRKKSPVSIANRPAPPTPETVPRYESNLYPATPTQQMTERPDNDSDNDFEEMPTVRIKDPADMSQQNSGNAQTATPLTKVPGTSDKGTYVNIEEDQSQDYVNVENEHLKSTETKAHPVYIEVLPDESDEKDLRQPLGEKTEASAGRKSINSSATLSLSLSDSLCHSYENITRTESPASGTADFDYVNVAEKTRLS
ncbi:Hypothetical predicted protein [Pelobates cultripes]|uniref:Uncharacterized protein n=1 Tax=Pelobates cultripes TaxID=61616 RepID=A0AAD1STS8_PELCU|nr:Hypothetical predicted protein [Pelobates cultripes]